MNVAIIQLTIRQMLGQRRSLLLVAAALIPVLIALVYRFNDASDNTMAVRDVAPGTYRMISTQPRWAAQVLLSQLIVGTLLPLGALIFGTAAIGSEIEDGTAVYLLSKPIPRWKVVASKLLVAWGVTTVLVLVATIASTVVALDHPLDYRILVGFSFAVVSGALVYVALFVLLSIITSRALIVGLLYVFIWEAVLTRLFTGLRYFSIREYALGIAGKVIDAPPAVFTADLDGAWAIFLVVAVSSLLFVYAARQLATWEIGEST